MRSERVNAEVHSRRQRNVHASCRAAGARRGCRAPTLRMRPIVRLHHCKRQCRLGEEARTAEGKKAALTPRASAHNLDIQVIVPSGAYLRACDRGNPRPPPTESQSAVFAQTLALLAVREIRSARANAGSRAGRWNERENVHARTRGWSSARRGERAPHHGILPLLAGAGSAVLGTPESSCEADHTVRHAARQTRQCAGRRCWCHALSRSRSASVCAGPAFSTLRTTRVERGPTHLALPHRLHPARCGSVARSLSLPEHVVHLQAGAAAPPPPPLLPGRAPAGTSVALLTAESTGISSTCSARIHPRGANPAAGGMALFGPQWRDVMRDTAGPCRASEWFVTMAFQGAGGRSGRCGVGEAPASHLAMMDGAAGERAPLMAPRPWRTRAVLGAAASVACTAALLLLAGSQLAARPATGAAERLVLPAGEAAPCGGLASDPCMDAAAAPTVQRLASTMRELKRRLRSLRGGTAGWGRKAADFASKESGRLKYVERVRHSITNAEARVRAFLQTPGPAGPGGFRGLPGVPGPDGSPGRMGPMGFWGPDGLDGPEGREGREGRLGATGQQVKCCGKRQRSSACRTCPPPSLLAYSPCLQGAPGQQGPPGLDGLIGTMGARGRRGRLGRRSVIERRRLLVSCHAIAPLTRRLLLPVSGDVRASLDAWVPRVGPVWTSWVLGMHVCMCACVHACEVRACNCPDPI